mmetsp:Transcript_149554/g.479371  ORF Transcript_149554/g.479371 Transcript_149554/m.479371 type:complete len:293 (-) Transcript_149554:538-1416(-)
MPRAEAGYPPSSERRCQPSHRPPPAAPPAQASAPPPRRRPPLRPSAPALPRPEETASEAHRGAARREAALGRRSLPAAHTSPPLRRPSRPQPAPPPLRRAARRARRYSGPPRRPRGAKPRLLAAAASCSGRPAPPPGPRAEAPPRRPRPPRSPPRPPTAPRRGSRARQARSGARSRRGAAAQAPRPAATLAHKPRPPPPAVVPGRAAWAEGSVQHCQGPPSRAQKAWKRQPRLRPGNGALPPEIATRAANRQLTCAVPAARRRPTAALGWHPRQQGAAGSPLGRRLPPSATS